MGDKTLNERVLNLEQTVVEFKKGAEIAKPDPIKGAETVDLTSVTKSLEKLISMVDSLAGSHVELIEIVKSLKDSIDNAGRAKPRSYHRSM